jgi:histidine triad (HIT) family protein
VSAPCLFCDIIAGRAPASIAYEDDATVAFMDLFPVHRGHVLIVPRVHVRDLLECPAQVAGRLFELSGRLARAVVAATAADGFNVWTANGTAAGQEVFHLHLHLLPRFRDDAFGLRFPKHYPREEPRDALDRVAALIRSKV